VYGNIFLIKKKKIKIALNTICSFYIKYEQPQNDSLSLFIDENQLYFPVRRQQNRNHVTSA